MRRLQILIFLTLAISACTTEKENIFIKGKIIDNATPKLLYTAIQNDFYNGWFKDSVIIDSTGSFLITLSIDKPVFIGLQSKSNFKKMIIEPDKTYEIEIRGKQINIINNDDAQTFYDALPKFPPNAARNIPKDVSDYESIRSSYDEKFDNELQELAKINCSSDLRALITSERQVYYNFAISTIASINYNTAYRNNVTPENAVIQMWSDAINDTFITDATTKKTYYYYDLLRMAFWSNLYTKLDYESIKLIRKEKREQGLIHTYNIELAKLLLPEDVIEYYTATYIQATTRQKKFEKELINLFEEFKTDYPESKYTTYIAPNINEIEYYYEKVAREANENYKFVDNYENITSLAEALEPFNGKKVYVDIWATSCGYCKDEFKHNKKLKEILKSYGIEILYISLDSDRHKNRWNDIIKFYELEGNHIRATKELGNDLKEKLKEYSGMPHYLIIDKKGNIVNDNAARPSNISELEKQLKI